MYELAVEILKKYNSKYHAYVVSMEDVPTIDGSVSFQSNEVSGAQNSLFLFCMAITRNHCRSLQAHMLWNSFAAHSCVHKMPDSAFLLKIPSLYIFCLQKYRCILAAIFFLAMTMYFNRSPFSHTFHTPKYIKKTAVISIARSKYYVILLTLFSNLRIWTLPVPGWTSQIRK
jgi:hypothetical protein